jgi:hypothetical protein
MHFVRAGFTALVLTAFAPQARAQTPAPGYAPPPAGYAPPPAGYAPPPAGYAPPPGYSYPPPIGPFAPTRLGPTTLPFEEGYPIPPGYHQEMRQRKGLIVGGAVTFGVLYSLSATGVLLSGGGAKAVLVPVAGPFIEIANIQSTLSGSEGSGLRAMATTFMVLDGVGQAAGVAMLLVGLTQPKPLLVRDDVTATTVRITPLTMGHDGRGVGIGIVGTM